MKKIAISLIIVLSLTLIFVFAWKQLDRVTLTGQKSVPEEDLQWIPNFAELYNELGEGKQACLEQEFGGKVDSWRQDSNKYYFSKAEYQKIRACLEFSS